MYLEPSSVEKGPMVLQVSFIVIPQFSYSSYYKHTLRGNGTSPLCDRLPFEINNGNYFLLISFICTT